MRPRVEDRNKPARRAAALRQKRHTLQKPTSKVVAKNFLRLQSKVAKSGGSAKQHDNSSVRFCSSLEEKVWRHAKHNIEHSRHKSPDLSADWDKLLNKVVVLIQQVVLAMKLLKLRMKHVKWEEFAYYDGPMISEVEHKLLHFGKIIALYKAPFRLRKLLIDKLMKEFGSSFSDMVDQLEEEIWVQIVKSQRRQFVDQLIMSPGNFMISETSQQLPVASPTEQELRKEMHTRLDHLKSLPRLTEEEALRGFVQLFELATPAASPTADYILTEVVRQFALVFPAVLMETLSEHMHEISLSKYP